MDTGTAPKKTGKASPFGIPRRTIIIALTVVILAAVIFFLTAFSPFVTIPAGHTGIVTTFGRVEDYTLKEARCVRVSMTMTCLSGLLRWNPSLSV